MERVVVCKMVNELRRIEIQWIAIGIQSEKKIKNCIHFSLVLQRIIFNEF